MSIHCNLLRVVIPFWCLILCTASSAIQFQWRIVSETCHSTGMDSRSTEQATMSIHCNLLRVVIPFWCLILMYCRNSRYNSNGGLYRKPAIRCGIGQQVNGSGYYEHTLQSVKGCDSILVLNFDVLPEFRDTIPMADCIGNLPFDWHGQQVNGAGYYGIPCNLLRAVIPSWCLTLIYCRSSAIQFQWRIVSETCHSTGMDSRSMEQATMSIHCNLLRVVIPFWCLILMYCRISAIQFQWRTVSETCHSTGMDSRSTEQATMSIHCNLLRVVIPFWCLILIYCRSSAIQFQWRIVSETCHSTGMDSRSTEQATMSIHCNLLRVVIPFWCLTSSTAEFRDTIPMADCIGNLPFGWHGQQVNGAGYYGSIHCNLLRVVIPFGA